MKLEVVTLKLPQSVVRQTSAAVHDQVPGLEVTQLVTAGSRQSQH